MVPRVADVREGRPASRAPLVGTPIPGGGAYRAFFAALGAGAGGAFERIMFSSLS
jgi:hypothetical protein